MRYKADITAGALKLPDSRLIADSLLPQVDAEGWKDPIVRNVLLGSQSRHNTVLIRGPRESDGADLWKLKLGRQRQMWIDFVVNLRTLTFPLPVVGSTK